MCVSKCVCMVDWHLIQSVLLSGIQYSWERLWNHDPRQDKKVTEDE